MKKTRVSITVLFLCSTMFAGCTLFETRDAEPPGSSRNTWQTPRFLITVLSNLRFAVQERDVVNYMRTFDADTFRFEADQVTLARDASMFEWGYSDEYAHATRLFSEGTVPRDSLLSVEFLSVDSNFTTVDSAEIHAQYELTAGVALEGVPRRMSGRADFYLHLGREGYWLVYRWRDNRTQEESTWSDLKSLVR